MKSCELYIAQPEGHDFSTLVEMPTVCLVALSKLPTGPAALEMVKSCMSAGAVSFASIGEHADAIEDQIDAALEGGELGWLEIVTTSHQGESVEDVVNFLVHGIDPKAGNSRLLIILDANFPDGKSLLEEARRACAVSS
ncbi:hypothetical protein ACUHMQ_16705 [Chitinimonas sp. PSY-7]|uniref:hypothetical protein n=1 Tax=Chitinimonas sp. PSY-7 TaxID=3459088 RepID=UPI00404026FF